MEFERIDDFSEYFQKFKNANCKNKLATPWHDTVR